MIAKIVKIRSAKDPVHVKKWIGIKLTTVLGSEIEVIWLSPTDTAAESEITAVHLFTPSGVVRLN